MDNNFINNYFKQITKSDILDKYKPEKHKKQGSLRSFIKQSKFFNKPDPMRRQFIFHGDTKLRVFILKNKKFKLFMVALYSFHCHHLSAIRVSAQEKVSNFVRRNQKMDSSDHSSIGSSTKSDWQDDLATQRPSTKQQSHGGRSSRKMPPHHRLEALNHTEYQ